MNSQFIYLVCTTFTLSLGKEFYTDSRMLNMKNCYLFTGAALSLKSLFSKPFKEHMDSYK